MTQCSYDGCEFECYEDSDKCIFHHDKHDWLTPKRKLWKEAKIREFWAKIRECKSDIGKTFDGFIFPKFEELDGIIRIDSGMHQVSHYSTIDNFSFGYRAHHHYYYGLLENSIFINVVFLDLANFSQIKLKNTNFKDTVFKKGLIFSWNQIENLKFDNATFDTNIEFNDMSINNCQFINTDFKNRADFVNCVFSNINFENSTFRYRLELSDTEFGGTSKFQGAIFEKEADFSNGVFGGEVDFSKCRFEESAIFSQKIFKSDVDFSGTKIIGMALFDSGRIQGSADFSYMRIGDESAFGDVQFEKDVNFQNTVFIKNVDFSRGLFAENVAFGECTFEGDAIFTQREFKGNVNFSKTTVKGKALFDANRIGSMANFSEATFENKSTFKDVEIGGDVNFSNTTFKGKANFENGSFEADAAFEESIFEGDAIFTQREFKGNTNFAKALIKGKAYFDVNGIQGEANFTEVVLEGESTFKNVEIHGNVNFSNAILRGKANFENGSFGVDVAFEECTFEDDIVFTQRDFKGNTSFSKALIKGKTNFENGSFGADVTFEECTFEDDAVFNKVRFLGDVIFDKVSAGNIFFKNSRLEEQISQTNNFILRMTRKGKYGTIDLTNAYLGKDIEFSEGIFDAIHFINCKVSRRSEVSLRRIEVGTLIFKKYVNESDKTIFDFVAIGNNLVIEDVGFEKERFNQTDISKAKVEIKNSSFNDNFFNSVKWGTITEQRYRATRDIFRQLKFFSEKQKNFIDADGFYSLEMKEQKKELKKENQGLRGFERIAHYLTNIAVFYIHEKTSNFSQNWLLPIYWLFILGMLGVIATEFNSALYYMPWICPILILLLSAVQVYKIFWDIDKVQTWIIYLVIAIPIVFLYLYVTGDWLDDIAKIINPSKIFKSTNSEQSKENIFEFGHLLFKIAVLFLVYQVVIAMKKKVRSK